MNAIGIFFRFLIFCLFLKPSFSQTQMSIALNMVPDHLKFFKKEMVETFNKKFKCKLKVFSYTDNAKISDSYF